MDNNTSSAAGLSWCNECSHYHMSTAPCTPWAPMFPPMVSRNQWPESDPLAVIQARLDRIEKLLKEIKWKLKTRKT